MLKRVLLSLLIAYSSLQAIAQNGSLSGTVVDATSSETVIGANVVIQGTTVGAATDIDGKFTIANVKPGTYNLVVSFVTYKTHIIPDVVVESGKKTSIQVALHEDVTELKEVVVSGTREINTDLSLVHAIKEAKLVVSGISSEQLVRLPDRDAAQAVQRVSGVTIQDNRFVLVRGVPERYNQVMINGIIGPSTEIDRRSFSFDLIPAGAIDQILVYKSGSAELPGDFGGGVIRVITKKPGYETNYKFGLTTGIRTNTTFQDYYSSQGSSTDILGFDNGFRDLPENFPTTASLKASTRNSSFRERAGKSLTNNFDYTKRMAPVDLGFNFSTNQHFDIGTVKFANLTAITYSNSYQHYTADFLRYSQFETPPVTKRFEYKDDFYSNNVRFNAIHNWAVELSPNSKIEFKNLFVQLSENETTIRNGLDVYQNPNFDRTNYAYHFLARSIYSGQLEGTHLFNSKSTSLNWVVGASLVERNEPDYRRFRTLRDVAYRGTEEPYFMQLPSAGNVFETGRFWSDLKDQSVAHGLNFEKKFNNTEDTKRPMSVKAGYYGEQKTRSFNARYMNYLFPDGPTPEVQEELIKLPLSEVFSPAHISGKGDGFVIEEGTSPEDYYSGENTLLAAYASGAIPVGKFDVSLGLRGEYNIQKLTSATLAGPVNVDNPVFSSLPFLNLAYNVSDRSLVRAAYSRTVNRPEFRELAPFLYYQFEYEIAIYGNPGLKTATINNIDLRWEMYPNPGEMISLGAFFKDFADPIETYLQITSENPQLYYRNAPKAKSTGLEIEFRKSLASLGVSRLLRNTSFNLNASWIKSTVDIGDFAPNQSNNRPLQGQSPYIINLGLYYFDEESGLSVNTAYNVFGPRIFSVGDKSFPSWWELPRNSLDFQIAKTWKDRFELKLNIQNLLNASYRIYQDNNNDNKIDKEEAVIKQYKIGSQFSAGLSWKFGKE